MTQPINTEPFEVDQHIAASSRYYAGQAGSAFYIALRDEKKILGSPCKTCGVVYWPPRTTCGRCFSELKVADMIPLGPEGTLETFTRVTYREPVHPPIEPENAPIIYGIIRLDGADTGLTHLIGEVPFDDLKPGLRMTPVFAEERKGNILDIKYFKPADKK